MISILGSDGTDGKSVDLACFSYMSCYQLWDDAGYHYYWKNRNLFFQQATVLAKRGELPKRGADGGYPGYAGLGGDYEVIGLLGTPPIRVRNESGIKISNYNHYFESVNAE